MVNDDRATPLFTRAVSPTARLMLYSLLAVMLMAMDHRGQYVPRMRDAATLMMVPVYQLIEWPFMAGARLREELRLRGTLEEENQALRERLLQREAELNRFQDLLRENARLRTLLDADSGTQLDYLYAELLNVDLARSSQRLLINRGRRDGVTDGQAVVDGSGVVGQVEQVLPASARVRMISDPTHALPVQVARTGLRTVAYGTGDRAFLLLPDVPLNEDVQAGDRIVTSGLGGRFPPGYPVARVISVERIPGDTFARVYARPSAALGRGKAFLLVRPLTGGVTDSSVVAGAVESESAEVPADQSPDQAADPLSGPSAAPSTNEPDAASEGAAAIESLDAETDTP